jgi:signal transduction histidine kinase/CheY-like chemotaxis protein
MLSRLPFALEIEIRRVDVLYEQNRTSPYIIFSVFTLFLISGWGQIPLPILSTVGCMLLLAAFLRGQTCARWFKIKDSIGTFAELQKWHNLMIYGTIFSAFALGLVGLTIPFYYTLAQKFFLGISLLAVCSGSVTAYSASRACGAWILCIIVGMWAIANLVAGGESITLTATLAFFIIVHLRLVRNKAEDFDRTLRLNLELHENKEKLRLALDSSGAISWEWNPITDELMCDSNMERLLNVDLSRLHSLADYICHVLPEDREALRSAFRSASKQGMIDNDHRLQVRDGSIRFIAARGQAQIDKNQNIVLIAGIFWDITAKKLAEKERFERDLLQTADRAKLLFLANVSHEIRTPLTAINGFAETTLRDSNLPQRAREHLRIILRSGRYLTSVVHDLLDLSKAETGNIFIQKTKISLVQEIVDSLNVVQSSINKKGLRLNVIYETPIPETITSDPTRLRQILINLLSNAVKYTDKGSVTLRAAFRFIDATGNGQVQVTVSDTGVGISEAQRHKLFQPFTRGEDCNIKQRPGSGLGLALARSLALRMSGDLRLLNSDSEHGGGSTFELLLESGPVEGVKFISDHPGTARPEVLSFEASRLRLKGKSILLVEDDEDIRWLLQDFLQREGARVTLSKNGQEALQQAFLSRYDAILMDINMPVMDGYTATTLLRQKGFRQSIVALTAHASSSDELLCYQAGCDCYLSKPIDFSYLLEVLREKQPLSQANSDLRPVDPAL